MPSTVPSGRSTLALAALAAACLALPACCTVPPKQVITAHTQNIGQPAMDQESFATSDAAGRALIAAVQSGQRDQLDKLFGPEFAKLGSGDPVQDKRDLANFIRHANERATVQDEGPDKSIILLGNLQYPFPIPIVKAPNSRWFFDTRAGEAEILARRIGQNELAAIRFCHTFVEAEHEYDAAPRDSSGVLAYAQRFLSTPGAHNGLYWENKANPDESPLGPLAARAERAGYSTRHAAGAGPKPFHGYLYHILTRQGSDAVGGPYSYIINGHMIAGFALVAWPATYDNSGRMTFMVNQQGQVYQKDLGAQTDTLAPTIKSFNPDKTWTSVPADANS